MKRFSLLLYVATTIIVVSNLLIAQSGFDKDKRLEYLKANLTFLSSDELEGREAATRGEKVASLFIAQELEQYGVKPFGDDGTYFQSFALSLRGVEKGSNLTLINQDGVTEKLNLGEDFYLSLRKPPSEEYSGKVNEIVFAGYGLTSEDNNYDDYRGLDVKGKIVLLSMGSPKKDGKSLFPEKKFSFFAQSDFKYDNAIKHGAAGILFVPSEMIKRYWRFLKMRALSPSVELPESNEETNNDKQNNIPVVILSEDAAQSLLSNEKLPYDNISEALEAGSQLKGFPLNKKIQLSYKTYSETKTARNVIGLIEGTDPVLKNEYVTMSAHYDHLGKKGDEIYNGADDDGSGTVSILEAARRLSLLHKNKRSVLVIFHTGEEKGLLGSEYFTEHSKVLSNIVVNINSDMVGRKSSDSIFCIGSGKLSTELYNLVKEVNKNTINIVLDYRFDDPNDPNRYYYRSDHYNYAKHGIPIVFFYDHMVEDYHKPTDDVEKINFDKIDRISTLITKLALRIANLDHKLIVDKKGKERVDTR